MDVEARAEALAIAAYEAAEPGGKPWARLEPGEWERWRRVANLVLAPSEAPAQRLTDERAVIHIGFISHDTLTRLQDSDWQKQRGDVADPAVIFTMNNPPSRCVIPVYIESAVRAQAGDAQDAARDVLAERERQKRVEGWTPEHDDEHSGGEMVVAAACYALCESPAELRRVITPISLWRWTGWAASWFKPKDKRRNLIRAAALLIAEIERLDRAAIDAQIKEQTK